MKNKLKISIGIIELIYSILVLILYSKSFYSHITCPPNIECSCFSGYRPEVYWPVGILLLFSSIILLKTKSWYSQLTMLVIIPWLIWHEFIVT